MASRGYLGFPHVRGDRLTFAAQDDVWLAPDTGGRAWRLSADRAQASQPRLSPDGDLLAWTSWRDGAPEVYLADPDGGTGRRLTYWGDARTRVRGWTPDGAVLAVTASGQPFGHFTSAHVVPVEAGPSRRLELGPVDDLAASGAATALLTGFRGLDPATWKRYRGGGTGRLWVSDGSVSAAESGTGGAGTSGAGTGGAGTGGGFTRVLADLGGQLACPMLIGDRLAFLSDHEGTGNVYSCLHDGTDLRRHTDHDGFYARNASSDGTRVVYQCAGDLWILDDLDAEARQLEILLGSPAAGRSPRLMTAQDGLGSLSCDESGRASAIEFGGTVHWLTHRDGPARALAVAPDAHARLPKVLGKTGLVAWVTDASGQDAIEVGSADGGDVAAAGTAGTGAAGTGAAGTGAAGTGAAGTGAAGTGAAGTGAGIAAPTRRLADGVLGSVAGLSASPDGTALAVASHDGRLILLDVASGGVTEIAASDNGPVTGLGWSPDSAWLAWSHPGPSPLRRIQMARVAGAAVAGTGGSGTGGSGTGGSGTGGSGTGGSGTGGDRQAIDVTDGRFIDTDPVFTADGLYLAFLSVRSFDPVYDAHFFDLSFPYGCRPYLVTLAAATPSPFGPLLGGRPVDDEADEPGGGAGGGAGSSSGAAGASGPGGDAPETVIVDVAGLATRIAAVPVGESRYSALRAVKDGLAWLREPVAGVLGEGAAEPDAEGPKTALERFDLKKRTSAELVAELDWFEVSGDGSRLVVGDGDRVRVLPSASRPGKDGSDDDDTVTVDLARARFRADPAARWRHAYEEAGRLIRRDFWIADMADVDWDGVLDTYRPLLDRIAGPSDFTDLLWEVLGELGSSHAYVMPGQAGDGKDSGDESVGVLGADLEPGGDGTWRVARVLPGESSDPLARSPLAAPGTSIGPGDVLLAIDGQPVDPVLGPGPLLAGAAGKPVELTIAASGDGDGRANSDGGTGDGGTADERVRRAVVVPLADDRRLRYQDWVTGRRQLVRELSGGRLGYLHVPDMMGEGWAHFHRDLRVEMACDGLVVDVRSNRGGHVSELVVEKLARRIMGWIMPRGLRPGTYPQDVPRGPLVALTDEYAGSDGDMVTAAIRILGLGPVVGMRTWGGVIGIEGMPGWPLVEGTHITVPRYAIWLEGYGWGVENHGVDPDVEVAISPDDWAAGRDPQLETGVRLAMEALAARPPAQPPATSDRPSRARPPLPPRERR
jgi:tricorn protease